ncbi:hypothetical protein E4U23_003850 [Claviceps purpurea]|nr:hypothetical protein E4U23_003850 [Claviceps purpurea]
MAYDSSDADYSSDAELAVVERWIDPATEHNLEKRTRDAHYPNIKNVAAALEVPYYRIYGRHKGQQPISHNGGQLAVLTPTEDQALLIWAHRQVMCGHHIQIRRHRLHVKRYSELLVAIRRSRSAGPAVT